MTDQQINTAIAEACGWTEMRDNMVGKAPGETSTRVMFLPLYCLNLNAMHSAEKHLFEARKDNQYGYELATGECATMWHATARERAEAFLKVLGKWEEAE